MTYRVYIGLGPKKAGEMEALDQADPTVDLFQNTGLKKQIGDKNLDVFSLEINPSAPDFPSIKNAFATQFSSFRSDYLKNPLDLDMVNLLDNLDHPGSFTISIAAGKATTERLRGIFQKNVVSVDQPFEGTDKDLNRLAIRFKKVEVNNAERERLKQFMAFMEEKQATTPETILQRYTTDYLNLFRFAEEMAGGLALRPWSDVTPLLPDEPSNALCSAEKGAVFFGTLPEDEPNLFALADQQGFDKNKPIVAHYGSQQFGREDVIYLPLRKIQFGLGKDVPSNRAVFRKTVAAILEDLYQITAGKFAETCGTNRLPDFGGELKIYFVGMADPTGTPERNQDLSERRAAAIAAEFVRQLRKRNQEEPLKTRNGLKVFYGGAGEQGTQEIDPKFRQTRTLVMSRGLPEYQARWREIEEGFIAGSPEMQGTQGVILKDHCVGQPEGCEELLGECLDAIRFICEAIPGTDVAQCTKALSDPSLTLDNIEQLYPKIAYWLRNGYFQLPVFHSAGQTLDNYTVKECFQATRHLLWKYGPHRGRDWPLFPENATNEWSMSLFKDNLHSFRETAYCTEDRGWTPRQQCRINDEPLGEAIRCGTPSSINRIAKLGRNHLVVRLPEGSESIDYSPPGHVPALGEIVDGDGRTVHYPPFRAFHFDPTGKVTNEAEVMAQITKDIEDALNGRGFFKTCYQKKVNKLSIWIAYTYESFDEGGRWELGNYAHGIKEKLEARYAKLIQDIRLYYDFPNVDANLEANSVSVAVAAETGDGEGVDGYRARIHLGYGVPFSSSPSSPTPSESPVRVETRE